MMVLLASLLGGCVGADIPSTATVDAPTWERAALGDGGADFVGAVDLDAVRADPLFGPLVEQLARKDDVRALSRASQIDLVASVVDGEPASWIAVVHGVDGPPGDRDAAGLGKIVPVRGAWIVGEGAAFRRVGADPSLAPARVAMPARALLAATIQGRAIPRPHHPELVDTTEGLRDATLEILGGRHFEVIMTCRYVDARSARHGATAARLLLVAAASRLDGVSALARALTRVDFDVSGNEVSVRVTLSDDLRELLQDYVARATR
jgi:hypothetical protein